MRRFAFFSTDESLFGQNIVIPGTKAWWGAYQGGPVVPRLEYAGVFDYRSVNSPNSTSMASSVACWIIAATQNVHICGLHCTRQDSTLLEMSSVLSRRLNYC
jgi:hypothetical protein